MQQVKITKTLGESQNYLYIRSWTIHSSNYLESWYFL